MQPEERAAAHQQIRAELEELYGRHFSLLTRLEERQEDLFAQLEGTLASDNLTNPHAGRHSFIALAVKAMKTVRAIHLLATEGFSEDALALARSALSAASALHYMARDVDRLGHDYVDWGLFEKHERMRRRVEAKEMTQAEFTAAVASLTDHEREIIQRFTATGWRTWSGNNDRELAELAVMSASYDLIYPHASSVLHGSVEGLASYLDEYRRFGQMTLGASTNESRLLLSVTIGAALVVLDRVIDVFSLPRDSFQALIDEAQALLIEMAPTPEEIETVHWDYGLTHPDK